MADDVIVDGFHALLGQRAGVLDFLRAVGIGPAMQHAARAELLPEVREVLRRRVVAQLRLLLGIQVIEIAEELIEAVHGRQVLVPVAEMVFPELAGGIAERLQQLGDGGIFGLHARGGARQPHLAQSRCGRRSGP